MLRSQEKQSDILCLYALLTDFVSGGDSFPIEALKSQSSLAHYSNSSIGIKGCSLNTLKTKANALIPGGFKELDVQRRKALVYANKLSTNSATRSGRSKFDLGQKITSLNKDVSCLEEDLLTLSVALENAISRATYYAKMTNDPLLFDRWKSEQAQILLMLSLRKRFART